MRSTKKIAIASLIIAALLTAAGHVEAQSGPAPGYDDPVAYAADYAGDEASSARESPGGYAGNKTAPGAAEREASHAAWLSCWAIHHATGSDAAGACSEYYVPPREAAPEQPAAEPVAEPARDRVDDAAATADDVVDAARDAAEDPSKAPRQVWRIVGAVVGFAERTADAVLELVDTAGLGLSAGASTVASGSQGAGNVVVDALKSVAGAASDASSEVGKAIESVADSVGDAGDRVGRLAHDAARAVGQVVGSLFGSSKDAPESDLPEAPPVQAPEAGDVAHDLTRPVRDLVDA